MSKSYFFSQLALASFMMISGVCNADAARTVKRVPSALEQKSSSSSSSTSSDNSTGNQKAINDYFNSSAYRLQEDKAELNTKMEDDLSNLPKYVTNNEGVFILTSEKVDINQTSETLFASEDNNNIYPGCIVHINDKLKQGHPQALNVKRGKITVRLRDMDNGAKTTYTVSSVSAGAINSAKNELLRPFYSKTTFQAPSNVAHKVETYTNTTSMALDLGCDLNFLKVTCKAGISTNSKQTEVMSVTDLSQKFYTIAIDDDYRGNIAQLFADDVALEEIKAQIQKYGPLAIITDVTYGRRAYQFEKVTSSDYTLVESVKAEYSGQKANQKLSYSSQTTNTNRFAYIQGGSSSVAKGYLTNQKQIDAAFGESLNLSASNQGVPLTYTVKTLNDSHLSSKKTGSYTEIKYIKAFNNVRVKWENRSSMIAGADVKIIIEYNVSKFDGNQVVPVSKERKTDNGYMRKFEVHEHGEKVYNYSLDLKNGEFLDPNSDILVRIRYQKDIANSKYVEGASKQGRVNSKEIFINTGGGNYATSDKKPYLSSSCTGWDWE